MVPSASFLIKPSETSVFPATLSNGDSVFQPPHSWHYWGQVAFLLPFHCHSHTLKIYHFKGCLQFISPAAPFCVAAIHCFPGNVISFTWPCHFVTVHHPLVSFLPPVLSLDSIACPNNHISAYTYLQPSCRPSLLPLYLPRVKLWS